MPQMLIGTGLLGGLTLWTALYRPRSFALVLVFLLPFLPKWAGLRFSDGLPLLNPLKIMLFLMVISWWANRRRLTPLGHRPLATALAVLVAAEALSIGWSVITNTGNYLQGFTIVGGKILYFYGLYVIVYDFLDSRRTIDALVTALAVAGVICGVQAFLEVFFDWNPYNLLPRYDVQLGVVEGVTNQVRLGLPRAQGAFTQSISFGIYLGMVLPLLFYRAGVAATRFRRAAWSLGGVMVAGGEILTLSRGAMGATLLVLIGIMLRTWRGRVLVGLLAVSSWMVLKRVETPVADAARTLIVGTYDPRVSEELASSTSNRVDFARMGLEDARRGLPFGLGPQYRGEYLVSVYFMYLIRSGVIALAAIAYIIFTTLAHMLRARRHTRDLQLKRLYLWLFAGAATFAVSLLTVDQDDTFFFFFILAATADRLAAFELTEADQPKASAVAY